jgi:NADH:ubiquinone oxidoreductase subunit 6 (subunit J)
LRSYGATAAPPFPAPSDPADLAPLARLLFSEHLLSFEALSILLLAALVGAFALARREGSP